MIACHDNEDDDVIIDNWGKCVEFGQSGAAHCEHRRKF